VCSIKKGAAMNICVIPARGGSKRILKKNIKNFLGKPIIAYSIEAALNSQLFDKVIVSTDDESIAKVAKEYGAEIPFVRPKKLSDDFTNTNDVVKHAINWFLEQDIEINYVCCIYATAPFVKVTYLRQGLELLSNSNQLFSFSVTSFPFPVQRAIKINNDKISMFYPEYTLSRSQDLDEAYHDAGQFYWGRPQAFLDEVDMFSEDSIPVVLPRYLVQDIDTLEDWKRAELMYKTISYRD
jgi:pseudaminic acid cytidylyltransferase